MWTENDVLRHLRSCARRALPERAFLHIDRGAFLFVSNAPCFEPLLSSIPGFRGTRRGTLLYLLPDASRIYRMERSAEQPPSELSASLLRFKGSVPDEENIKLWTQGIKLLNAKRDDAAIKAYDRALRQRAACALRGACGGALYACALIDARLQSEDNIMKEEM